MYVGWKTAWFLKQHESLSVIFVLTWGEGSLKLASSLCLMTSLSPSLMALQGTKSTLTLVALTSTPQSIEKHWSQMLKSFRKMYLTCHIATLLLDITALSISRMHPSLPVPDNIYEVILPESTECWCLFMYHIIMHVCNVYIIGWWTTRTYNFLNLNQGNGQNCCVT